MPIFGRFCCVHGCWKAGTRWLELPRRSVRGQPAPTKAKGWVCEAHYRALTSPPGVPRYD